ncbi:MAG: hypothetical protein ACO26G_07205, partial [Rickettsiales bacterium]
DQNILVQTSKIDDFVNFTIQTSLSKTPVESNTQTTPNLFYIDSPKDLKIQANTLEIESLTQDSSSVEISKTTPFAKFIQQASQNPQNNYQLLINWENFTPNQRVAFNSLFDSGNRSINQQAIPDNIQIIAVEKPKEIKDPSVLSRFDKKITLSYDLQKQITEELQKSSSLASSSSQTQPHQIHSVDLEGDPDWQGKLFGKIKLNGNNLAYEKSEFVKFLEQYSSSSKASETQADIQADFKFEFKNIDKENAHKLQSLLNLSKAQGFIDYHGQKITLPKNLQFSFSDEQFDFASLSASSSNSSSSNSSGKHSVTTDFVLNQPQESENLTIINQSDFEKLLVQVKIPSKSSGETYQELPGLIEDASSKDDKKLSLLITSELSTNQWYLLLKKAQENAVQLDLKIAKGVNLPDNEDLKSLLQITQFSDERSDERSLIGSQFLLQTSSTSPQLSDSKETSSPRRIFIVDDSSEYIKTQTTKLGARPFQEAIIVDIEEQNFDSLFGKRDFEIKKSKDTGISGVDGVDGVDGASGDKQSFVVYKESNGLEDILTKHPDKKIILRGEFDKSTMQILTEKILSADPKYQNLYFILEDKNLTETSQEAELQKLSKTSLAFLGADFYEEKAFKPRVEEGAGVRDLAGAEEEVKKPIIREVIPSIDTFYTKTDEQITATSETFKAQRKALIETNLQENKMLIISGSAGVGKSYFMQSLAKEQDHQIFFG